VAVDVQGADVARPYYEKHSVTFPRLVDQENRLGAVFGLSAVPNTHVIDEAGLFRGAGVGQDEIEALLRESVVAGLDASAARLSLDELAARAEAHPDDATALVAYADALRNTRRTAEAVPVYERALKADERCLPAYFGLSSAHLADGDKVQAAEALKRARKLFPKNWIVRKQIWAIEHPERFYEDKVDYGWQKEQLAAEDRE